MDKCSSCGKQLTHKKPSYNVHIQEKRCFEHTFAYLKDLQFCETCASDIKGILQRIEKKLNYKLGPECWKSEPQETGAHFVWYGDKMEVRDVKEITGKEKIIPVSNCRARLWAGPINPPILPITEKCLVHKLKK